jgi:hypothetical protein
MINTDQKKRKEKKREKEGKFKKKITKLKKIINSTVFCEQTQMQYLSAPQVTSNNLTTSTSSDVVPLNIKHLE